MKYPYIGKCESNGLIVLFYKSKSGTVIDAGNSATAKARNYSEKFLEVEFKDITREYLADTYGKIESSKHAEFIIKLAENSGYIPNDYYKTGDFFYFESASYGFAGEKLSSHDAKLINIPLPPKDDKSDYHIHKANTEKLAKLAEFMSKAGIGSIGDEAVDAAIDALSCYINSSGEAQKEPESKEWPKVGDGVLYDGSSHRLKSIKGEVLKVIARYSFDGIDYITLLHDYDGVFAMPIGSWIKKPKTPEEELRDELIAVTDKYRNHELSTQEVIAKAIINCEIKGLTYKL